MIKTIINKFIRAALDELFINAPSVQLSLGADLFSDSSINLANLTLRPDLFDVYLQPFRLVFGHVGQVTAEGIAELALGGKLRFQAENIYLLFQLDNVADPEKVQTMRKILLELQSAKFSPEMLMELLRRIHGLPPAAEVDVTKKRKVVYKVLDYLSKGLFLTIKNVHVRFEFMDENEEQCDALGLRIPYIKIHPGAASSRPDNMSRNDPLLAIQIKNLQVYCDYHRASYASPPPDASDASPKASFEKYQKSGLHTSLVTPFDVDVVLGLDLKRSSGLVCPKVQLSSASLRLCLDPLQVKSIHRMMEAFLRCQKRFEQALHMQKIFRTGFPLPRIFQVVGVRCLPHLYVRNEQYPQRMHLSQLVTSNKQSRVAFMKHRVGNRWALMMWKYVIRIVLHDLRRVRPLGRWKEIARLTALRREYVFLYAKLLQPATTKPSSTGSASTNAGPDPFPAAWLFNVNATISQTKLRDLFEMEMQCSPQAIEIFRSLATLVAAVSLAHTRRGSAKPRAATTAAVSSAPSGWEKTALRWPDVLGVFVELWEARWQASFHRFDRSPEAAGFPGGRDVYPATHDDWDDRSSQADDTASSSFPARPSDEAGAATGRTPRRLLSASSAFFTGLGLSASASASAPSTAMSSGSAHGADDYDSRVLRRLDLSALGGLWAASPPTATATASTPSTPAGAGLEAWPPATSTTAAGGVRPDRVAVSEAVAWTLRRYAPALQVLPPDVSARLEAVDVQVKTPLVQSWDAARQLPANDYREARLGLLAASLQHVAVTLALSQSSSSTTSPSPSAALPVRAFDALSGALIQMKVVVRQAHGHVAVPPLCTGAAVALSPARRRSGRDGLSAGLPAYPVPSRGDDDDDDDGDDGDGDGDTHSGDGAHSETAGHEDGPSGEWKSIPGVSNPRVKYLPGHTLLESLQQLSATQTRSPPRPSSGAEAEAEAAARPAPRPAPGLTIDSDMDDMHTAPSSAGRSPQVYRQVQYVLREFVSSSPGDQVFILCMIFDLDRQGEGAGDVQVHVGSIRWDLSHAVLAALLSPLVHQSLQDISQAYAQLAAVSSLRGEPLLLLDWDTRRPLVHARYAHWDFLAHCRERDDDDDDGEDGEEGRDGGETRRTGSASLSSAGGSPSEAEPGRPRVDRGGGEEAAFAAYQRSLLLHRNMAQWLSYLTAYLPKVMSVSLRLSTMLVQSLEAHILRDLIHARLHAMVDRAAQRSHASASQLLFGIDGLQGVLANLLIATLDPAALAMQLEGQHRAGRGAYAAYNRFRHVRKWGVKTGRGRIPNDGQAIDPDLGPATHMAAPSTAGTAKAKILIPSLDIAVMKAMLPLPSVAVHWQTMTVLQLPISDETLCHYLAFLLAQVSPFFYY